MATAYIREYAALGNRGGVDAPQEPALASQTVTTSGVSAQSAAFHAHSTFICISTPAAQAVAVEFGANPTAGATSLRLPANGVYYFGIVPGQKVALIDVT